MMIPLDGLKLRNSEDKAKKHVIALFNPSGQNVHPDYKELELLCKNSDEYSSWMESFSEALNNNKNVIFVVFLVVIYTWSMHFVALGFFSEL